MTTIRQILNENYFGIMPFNAGDDDSAQTRRLAVLALVEDLALGRMNPEDVEATQEELAAELIRFVDDILNNRPL